VRRDEAARRAWWKRFGERGERRKASNEPPLAEEWGYWNQKQDEREVKGEKHRKWASNTIKGV